jgi:nucleoid-associated protein YgaU
MNSIYKILPFLTILLFFASCGPDATKAVGDAKSAIERARLVEAPAYSADEFHSASSLYDMAKQFLDAQKSGDAVKKALESKDMAEKSFTNAVIRRADAIYQKDTDLLAKATAQFADKLAAAKIRDARSDYDLLSKVYQAKDYDGTYTNGTNLAAKLADIVDYTAKELDRVKGVIAAVQGRSDDAVTDPDVRKYAADDLKRANDLLDGARASLAQGDLDPATNQAAQADAVITGLLARVDAEKAKDAVAEVSEKYENASKQDIVIKYAADVLVQAKPLIDDARTALDKSNWADARSKARDASQLIDDAVRKAEEAYRKVQAVRQTNTIDLDRQQELEAQKKRAAEFIEEAKQRLEKLRSLKKTGFLEPVHGDFAYILPGMFHLSDNVGRDNAGASSATSISSSSNVSTNTSPTEALVEKYIRMAEDAYANEEYLDAIDYAREAIRIADVLLSDQAGRTYTVQLRPNNRDCLWKIAGYMYDKQYWLWPMIWRANKYLIQDPDLIYPGQEFKVPPLAGK